MPFFEIFDSFSSRFTLIQDVASTHYFLLCVDGSEKIVIISFICMRKDMRDLRKNKFFGCQNYGGCGTG